MGLARSSRRISHQGYVRACIFGVVIYFAAEAKAECLGHVMFGSLDVWVM